MLKPEVKSILNAILNEYIDGKIDISRVAEKSVDTLFPWETSYMPLLAHHEDPWAARARDIQLIEELMVVCGETGEETESFVECITNEIVDRYFNQ